MINLLVAGYLTVTGAWLMVKTSYYYLMRDTFKTILLEIVDVECRHSSKFGIIYHYTYKYNWNHKEKYYKDEGSMLKQIGDIDIYLVDPRFGFIFDCESIAEDHRSFFGMVKLLVGLGILLSYVL